MTDYSHVEREIAAGRRWRAKEILQGRLYHAGYDAPLFARYGRVLLELGDVAEAGKYLFLSGSRAPEFEDAIAIYLKRHAHSTPGALYGTFPASVRTAPAASYPATVIADLQAIGHPVDKLQRAAKQDRTPQDSRYEKYFGVAIGVIFLGLFAGFLIQGLRGLGWLFRAVNGN